MADDESSVFGAAASVISNRRESVPAVNADLAELAEIVEWPSVTETDEWLSLDAGVSDQKFKIDQNNKKVSHDRIEFLLKQNLRVGIINAKSTSKPRPTASRLVSAAEGGSSTATTAKGTGDYTAIIKENYNMLNDMLRRLLQIGKHKEYVTRNKNATAAAQAFYDLLKDDVNHAAIGLSAEQIAAIDTSGTSADPLVVADSTEGQHEPNQEPHPLAHLVKDLEKDAEKVQFYITLCTTKRGEKRKADESPGKGKGPAPGEPGRESASPNTRLRRSERIAGSS